MSNTQDRRAPGTARIQFDAMVEVGGTLGPSFEAQAVNLSEEGMSLRTAYLPEVGQPVMCRFDAGQPAPFLAEGEVLWKEDMGEGGQFGIRFTNLDDASADALQRVLGVEAGPAGHDPHPPMEPGHKVRLHIEGLASPMRARVKDQLAVGVTAYSELAFLEMGKQLELEDATTGNRRPAFIDRVRVETNKGSSIPQLVVSLRYDDARGRAASLAPVEIPVTETESDTAHAHATAQGEDDEEEAPYEPAPSPALAKDAVDDELDEESSKLKSPFARNAAKVTPALIAWAKRAKVTAALLAAKARKGGGSDDSEIPMRRTTAPAPSGGLHTAGRKVVRGSVPDRVEAQPPASGLLTMTKKKVAVAGSIGVAAILAVIALRKPAEPQLASAAPADTTATQSAPAQTQAAPAPVATQPDTLGAAAASIANGGPAPYTVRVGKPTPFTNGPVGAHPNVIKIKMDGPVEGILGATQPSGFTIVTPNRKATDSATSLASKDSRLEGIHIANESGGAELTVSFKDGVPNYIVRAHGDTLEMVLANPNGSSKAEANATPSSKHKKHHKKR